ncbi:unnamed protein product, partial [Vitis vinifera]|uniref:Uncharacterized protein n=1 Tax=Vitis vinifera TaxID=29760 RepID=D7SSA2_VITVI
MALIRSVIPWVFAVLGWSCNFCIQLAINDHGSYIMGFQ